jgi:uncharacterized MnhB-related membrane protein
MVDARFSAIAAVLSLAVAILAAADSALAVAIVFGLLAAGFALRAVQSFGRRE